MNADLTGWQHYLQSLQDVISSGHFDSAAEISRHLLQLLSQESVRDILNLSKSILIELETLNVFTEQF
jgi:Arc/MetJ-type ribon-helix-helix transcriptional regulator